MVLVFRRFGLLPLTPWRFTKGVAFVNRSPPAVAGTSMCLRRRRLFFSGDSGSRRAIVPDALSGQYIRVLSFARFNDTLNVVEEASVLTLPLTPWRFTKGVAFVNRSPPAVAGTSMCLQRHRLFSGDSGSRKAIALMRCPASTYVYCRSPGSATH